MLGRLVGSAHRAMVSLGPALAVLLAGCGSSGGAGAGSSDAASDVASTRFDGGVPDQDASGPGPRKPDGAGPPRSDAASPNAEGGSVDGAADARFDAVSPSAAVLMGVDAEAAAEFQTATGLTTQVVRVYLKGGDSIPSSTSAAMLDAYYGAGEAVVYSMKVDDSPDSEATNQANLSALAKDIVAEGYASKTWLVLHHEPYPELSGSAFQAMYTTYAPSIRAEGVRCGVIYQVYPVDHGEPNYASDYTSGILPLVDFLGIDVYPAGEPGGYGTDILTDISPFTTYAKDNGKPFQIDEVAVDNTVSGTNAQQAAWLSGLGSLGSDVAVVMYYEGSPGEFLNLKIENNPAAVTAWQDLYTSLTTR